MKNVPTFIAVLVIIAVVVIVVLIGLWYLNRPSPTPTGGVASPPKPIVPGGQPGQAGQIGQKGGQPVTPTY